MPRVLSRLKLLVVPSGRAVRTVQGGMFRGLKMELDLVSQTQLYLGLFERELHGWVQKLSAGISSAVDIGAGQGEYTLYFLSKTRARRVFSFEPGDVRAGLLKNLELNGLAGDPRLEVSSKLVGLEAEDECSLDSLLPSLPLPCLIKMDVDGGEVKILRGAAKLLQLPETRWIIETHSPQLEEDCIAVLQQAGFTTTIVPNAWWRFFIPELRPGMQNRWLIAVNPSCVDASEPRKIAGQGGTP